MGGGCGNIFIGMPWMLQWIKDEDGDSGDKHGSDVAEIRNNAGIPKRSAIFK